MFTIGYMCKTGETKVYGGIGKEGFNWSDEMISKAIEDWTSVDGNIIIDKSENEKWDFFSEYSCLEVSNGNIIQCDSFIRPLIKEKHKAAVNKAADTIRDGWLLCDTDPTPGAPHRNKSFLAIKSNREILTEKQKVVADKSSEIATEFPLIWVKTGKGDADRYSIEIDQIAPMYYAVEFTTQALVNIEIEVQNLILADFENPEIDIDTFEKTDYVNMTGGFMELFSTKTADAKVYAQPEDSPTAI